ncbi:MAG: molybdopterin-dependent oxidoreductase [Candidatus Aminicenantes bacterium]|nr:molybdopterin-dependent oxidoreductase [Candidatus Aminicenantes bacterium]
MTLTIDGRTITVEGRPTLLEAARANGIFVPSLCDHPGLDPYAACRLCLVEVKGRKGPVPACGTAAEDGMDVVTSTPELQSLRRGILELILAEHPHACLICAEKTSCDDLKSTIRKTGEVTGCVLCPVNGRCELQRVVEALGLGLVPFPSHRRPGEVRRDDPFIDRDNSLCILCGRCVRVCQEVRGASVLTFVSRGSGTVIGTALDRRLLDSGCQFCGACIDVCPTGSIAERAVRYDRPAETESKVVCPLCGQGCGLLVKSRGGRILGASPDPEGRVNHGQACVRGRFLARATVHHPRRLLMPMIRENGSLREASWEEALETAASRLGQFRDGKVTVTGSSENSCEDLFVLYRFASETLKAREVSAPWSGTAAARLREIDRAAGQTAPLNFRMSDVGRAETILLLGEDLPLTQPLVNLEVVRALRKNAVVISAGPANGHYSPAGAVDLGIPAGKEDTFLKALTAALLEISGRSTPRAHGSEMLEKSLAGFDGLLEAARLLLKGKPLLILFGPDLLKTGGAPSRMSALSNLAFVAGGRLVALDVGANLRGGLAIASAFAARFSGAAENPGGSAGPAPRALYVAGPMPKIRPAGAELVIVQGSYMDEQAEAADILLPETTAFEAAGTTVNVEGRIQVSGAAIGPLGEARPGWSILNSLAAKLGTPGSAYGSAEEVRRDLVQAVPAFAALGPPSGPSVEMFLIEEAAGPAVFVGAGPGRPPKPEKAPAAPGGPDVYKGLDLAREHKSLKLLRGRRCPRS